MSTSISIILCSHNPRLNVLTRAIEALRSQTLDLQKWEFLVVDNCSAPPLSEILQVDWHPNFSLVEEKQPGLTSARLRGIQEARSQLLVFVDDDNVLDASYLETALKLAADHARLGCFGGQIEAEYEEEPDPFVTPLLPSLAIRSVERDSWGNVWNGTFDSVPVGAGMVLRKTVAENYAKHVMHDPDRRALDRSGSSLSSCGDFDIVLAGYQMGFGSGVFADLKMLHVIAPERIQQEYLLKLAEEIEYGLWVLNFIYAYNRQIPASAPHRYFFRKILNRLLLGGFASQVYHAKEMGRRKALLWSQVRK